MIIVKAHRRSCFQNATGNLDFLSLLAKRIGCTCISGYRDIFDQTFNLKFTTIMVAAGRRGGGRTRGGTGYRCSSMPVNLN
jgi:hypothetical protein